jgi:hypothetical protein
LKRIDRNWFDMPDFILQRYIASDILILQDGVFLR